MFRNPFKKISTNPDRNIVDEAVNKLFQEGNTDGVESALVALKNKKLNNREVESWHHVYGICAFKDNNHEIAAERFEEGLLLCPESSKLKFSLAQEHIYLGKPKEAFPLFDQCVFPSVSKDYVLTMSRYAYIFSEYDRGIEYLEKFFDFYKELKILDDHFLYVRGMPFFGTAWSYLAAHCVLSNRQDYLKSLTDLISSSCHDYDFDFLGVELEAILSGNTNDLLVSLRNHFEETTKNNLPTAYTAMRISVFQSLSARTYRDAVTILDQVESTEDDFGWLEDIRTLAKANAANRFGDIVEHDLVRGFLARQPLLFEPDHAVSFGLLNYQEVLKPDLHIVASAFGR